MASQESPDPSTPDVREKSIAAASSLHSPNKPSTPSTPRKNVNVQVKLSRPIHRPGQTVVGSIRVGDEYSKSSDGPGSSSHWNSVLLFVVGYCRLDPRWHSKNSTYANTYRYHDQRTLEDFIPLNMKSLPNDFPDRHSVFWTARGEGLDLLRDVPPESPSSETFVRPQPIQFTTDWAEQSTENLTLGPETESATTPNGTTPNRSSTIDVSFRAHLPHYLPGTLLGAISCRYFYRVLLRLSPITGNIRWVEVPLVIQQSAPANNTSITTGGPEPMTAISHPGTLPYSLTATEYYGASPQYQKGSLTVHRFSAAFHGSSAVGPIMRITDPNRQQPVTVLSILTPTDTQNKNINNGQLLLCPGSRLILQFDFPNSTAQSETWVPCHQVSACIQGEESILSYPEVDSSTHSGHEKRKRTQQILVSTAHELVDPDTARRVSLSLLVPDNAIGTTRTAAVDISYECVVDICVASQAPSTTGYLLQQSPKYRNLRLQLPCAIVYPDNALETMHDMEQDEETRALMQRHKDLWNQRSTQDQEDTSMEASPPSASTSFATEDIEEDLKRLSIATAESNRWTQVPSLPL